MKRFPIAILALIVMSVTADQTLWENFKQKYGKSYGNAVDEWKHMKTFLENMRNNAKHNELFEAGKSTYEKGMNEFSDLTEEEFFSNDTPTEPEKKLNRVKRSLISDLEERCGPDQEKIDGECQDV